MGKGHKLHVRKTFRGRPGPHFNVYSFYVPKIVFDIIAWVFKFLLTLNDRIVQFVLVKM